MPILATERPVTQDESTRVLDLIRKHASPSAWRTLEASLRAKPDPYPFPMGQEGR